MDAADDQSGATAEPSTIDPHDPVEVFRTRGRVAGAVDLAEQVPHGRTGCDRPVGAAETSLRPPHGGERAGVLEQHPLRVGDRQLVVNCDLQQEVAVVELGSELVDAEGGKRLEPGGG